MPAAAVASLPADILRLILDAVDAMEKDRMRALLATRCMTRVTYPHASTLLLSSTHITSTDKLASMLAVLNETSVGSYIDKLVIGRVGRHQPHTPHDPLLEASPSTLVAILESARLSHLKAVRVGDIDWRGAFSLPAAAQTPHAARPSYIVVVSDEPSSAALTGGEVVLEWMNARLIVPKKSAWGGKAQPDVLMGLPVVHASVFRFERATSLADLDVTFPQGCATVGLYAGSMTAWAVFRQLLLVHGPAFHTLTVSWTTGPALNHCEETSAALAPGISACINLRHLTLGLFLGSAATVSIRTQWRAAVLLLDAVIPNALRTFTLVVTVHEDGDLDRHLDDFRDLPWLEAKCRLRRERCPDLKAVAYKVLGVKPGSDVAEVVSSTIEEGLCHARPVQGSKEPLFATRPFPA